jgi:Icc-related predicted phosphoesterase
MGNNDKCNGMVLGHFSDLHGKGFNHPLFDDSRGIDVWVNTGDFFDNAGRCGDLRRISAETERRYQTQWFGWKASKLMKLFRDKPVLSIKGNHDFVSLVDLLRSYGYQGETYEVDSRGIDFRGVRFAGFSEIRRIDGEWNGEVEEEELARIVKETMEVGNPEVLMTHVTPSGILCADEDHGSTSLSSWLAYRDHRVKAHLFGHDHSGMGIAQEMDVFFSNAATTVRKVFL